MSETEAQQRERILRSERSHADGRLPLSVEAFQATISPSKPPGEDIDAPFHTLLADRSKWFAPRGVKPSSVVIHCFPMGTYVGGALPAPIEQAEAVSAADGRMHKVLRHFDHEYVGPLTEIRATGTTPLMVTPNHPVLAVRPYRFPAGGAANPGTHVAGGAAMVRHYDKQPEYVPAGEIRPGDWLVAVPPRPGDEPVAQRWPLSGHPNERPVPPLEPTNEAAWMLGLYVADGARSGRSVHFTLAAGDPGIDRLTRFWGALGLKVRLDQRHTWTRVIVNSKAVSDALTTWCGGHSSEKHFPAFVFDGWPIAALLEGYVHGDGHLRPRGDIEVTTTSQQLLWQAHALLLSLGESPTVSARKADRPGSYPNARPSWLIRWTPGTPARYTRWWRGRYLMQVRAVSERPYSGTVHNLEVESEPSYSVGGAAVHNCTAATNPASSTANFFASSTPSGSTQAVADDNEGYTCVPDDAVCAGAPPLNQEGLHIEQPGLESWTRATWLSHMDQLHRVAYHVAQWCKKYSIPVVLLNAADLVRLGEKARGITYHEAISDAFHQSTHQDPGPGFPWDVFMPLVKGFVDGTGTGDEMSDFADGWNARKAATGANPTLPAGKPELFNIGWHDQDRLLALEADGGGSLPKHSHVTPAGKTLPSP